MPEITKPKIYGAIANVIADVGAVGKDKVNKQQGFKFRSIDDVYNALHPALAKNKVFIVPDILERDVEQVSVGKNGTIMQYVTCQIRFTFFAEDGSFVESTLIGEAMDSGDKATNKAMAIAYKYACFQVFCIPTEEMLDPDLESPNITGNKDKNKETPQSAKTEPPKENVQKPVAPPKQADQEEKVSVDMVKEMSDELDRTGVKKETILKLFQVKHLAEMSVINYKRAMKKFQATPDKKETENE